MIQNSDLNYIGQFGRDGTSERKGLATGSFEVVARASMDGCAPTVHIESTVPDRRNDLFAGDIPNAFLEFDFSIRATERQYGVGITSSDTRVALARCEGTRSAVSVTGEQPRVVHLDRIARGEVSFPHSVPNPLKRVWNDGYPATITNRFDGGLERTTRLRHRLDPQPEQVSIARRYLDGGDTDQSIRRRECCGPKRCLDRVVVRDRNAIETDFTRVRQNPIDRIVAVVRGPRMDVWIDPNRRFPLRHG